MVARSSSRSRWPHPRPAQTPDRIERPPLGSTLTRRRARRSAERRATCSRCSTRSFPKSSPIAWTPVGSARRRASRIGAHGSSWTQPVFRLDGIDISAVGRQRRSAPAAGRDRLGPRRRGDRPDADRCQRARASRSRLRPPSAVGLDPRDRRDRDRSGTARAQRSCRTRRRPRASVRRPMAARCSAARSRATAAGSSSPAAGTARHATSAPIRRCSTPCMGSLFTHLVLTPSPRDEVASRSGGSSGRPAPLENRSVFGQPTARDEDRALHGQLVWERHERREHGLVGVRRRSACGSRSPTRSNSLRSPSSASPTVPVEALLYPGAGTDTAWSTWRAS